MYRLHAKEHTLLFEWLSVYFFSCCRHQRHPDCLFDKMVRFFLIERGCQFPSVSYTMWLNSLLKVVGWWWQTAQDEWLFCACLHVCVHETQLQFLCVSVQGEEDQGLYLTKWVALYVRTQPSLVAVIVEARTSLRNNKWPCKAHIQSSAL